jgi:hypothetical protein
MRDHDEMQLSGLSIKAQDALRALEQTWARQPGPKLTLIGLSQRWNAFARAVEAGYVGYWEEYLNELTVRDLLNDAFTAVPDDDDDAARTAALFEQADAIYWRATKPDETGEMARMWRLDDDDGWWWRRFPSKLPVGPE